MKYRLARCDLKVDTDRVDGLLRYKQTGLDVFLRYLQTGVM